MKLKHTMTMKTVKPIGLETFCISEVHPEAERCTKVLGELRSASPFGEPNCFSTKNGSFEDTGGVVTALTEVPCFAYDDVVVGRSSRPRPTW